MKKTTWTARSRKAKATRTWTSTWSRETGVYEMDSKEQAFLFGEYSENDLVEINFLKTLWRIFLDKS